MRAARLHHLARAAWRHRGCALAVAWAICLIGWPAALLPPHDSLAVARPASGAPGLQPPASSPPIAALAGDLAAAEQLHQRHAARLAETPPLLDGQPNPLHERAAAQLQHQATLIAILRTRLAEARAAGPTGPATVATGAPARSGEAPGEVAAPPARIATLFGVLAIALTAAVATAAWQAHRAGTIDHPAQLAGRADLTLLGTIPVPAAPERQQALRGGGIAFALAALALVGLFACLVTVAALAPPGSPRG
jgi:hypothetical protein